MLSQSMETSASIEPGEVMKLDLTQASSEGKDRLGEKLRQAGKAREHQWATERDRELLDEIRRRGTRGGAAFEEIKSAAPRVFDTILCPIELDRSSFSGLDLAARLAAPDYAALYVLHVVRPALFRKMRSEETTKLLDAILELLSERLGGMPCRPLIVVGDPAEKILEVAHQVGADLVIVGKALRSTISRLVTRSVTERLLKTLSCPVLVMPSN